MRPTLTDGIIEKALACGASLAGITAAEKLTAAPSYGAAGREAWLKPRTSVLVLALEHPAARPGLDWWDGERGTAGNRKLIDVALQVCGWLRQSRGEAAGDLPYYAEAGGVFIKDAAVLAGLGVIGRNNLLVTPGFGPRVRLRAVLIDKSLEATPPLRDFTPCRDCPGPCTEACPRNAFAAGSYSRPACSGQMKFDEENRRSRETDGIVKHQIRYCRRCELACPVGSSEKS